MEKIFSYIGKNRSKPYKEILAVAAKLMSVAVKKEADMLEESLFILSEAFNGADLSVYSMEQRIFVATTIMDTEEEELSRRFASNLKKSASVKQFGKYTPGRPDGMREDVMVVQQIPLTCGMGHYFLMAEYPAAAKAVGGEEMSFYIDLLSITLWLFLVSDIPFPNNHVKMPGREELVNDVENPKAPLPKDKVLSVIKLMDAAKLNREIGEVTVDGYLALIKSCLQENYGSRVYRIGGTKFAVLFFDPVGEAYRSVEKVLDTFSEMNVPVSGIITEVPEDIYGALYVCESYLRKVNAGVVAIARDKLGEKAVSDYKDVSETYFASDVLLLNDDKEDTDDGIEDITPQYAGRGQDEEKEEDNIFRMFGGI